MAAAIYDLDAKTQQLLSRGTFAGKFSVKKFIEDLSSNHIITSRTSGAGAFDPKPYIRTFEAALDKLKSLRQELVADEQGLQDDAQSTERQHQDAMRQVKADFDSALEIFGSLDDRISSVSSATVSLGERLEDIERQRHRASEAASLITFYTEFSRSGSSLSLEKLRKKGTEGQLKCAGQIRRLTAISRKLDMPGSSAIRTSIEKYGENFEQDLLRDFDKAYRAGDLNSMKEAALILHEFNGGNSAVQVFVNQHDFFIVREKLEDEQNIGQSEIWKVVPDPDYRGNFLDPSFASLVNEIKTTCAQESRLISVVFVNPEAVMQVFLQRIFAQSIQQRLENLVSFAELQSTLAYLRTLQSAHTALSGLVEDLKRTSSGLTSNTDTPVTIAMLLDQALEDLFIPYLQGNRYIEVEKRTLQELYASFLYRFHSFHAQRKKTRGMNVFDKYYQQLHAAASESASEGRMGQLRRLAGLERSNSRDKSNRTPEVKFTEEDGTISVPMAKRMLQWLAESIGRSLELTSTSDTPKDAYALLQSLLEIICRGYIETALEYCLSQSQAQDSKSEPNLTFFTKLRSPITVMYLVFSCIETALLPLSVSSLTIRRQMVIEMQREQNTLEGKVNSVIQRTIELVLGHVSSILARQRKNDFRPRDEDLGLGTVQTAPSTAVASFLRRVHEAAKQALDGDNLKLFLTEVGVGVCGHLLDHFKRYTVNPAGALMLLHDVNTYQESLDSWNIHELQDGSRLLHEIGNLFIVKPDSMRSLLREGILARVKPNLLTPYLAKRTDFHAAGIESMIATSAPVTPTTPR